VGRSHKYLLVLSLLVAITWFIIRDHRVNRS
jgi:hypothetical protein